MTIKPLYFISSWTIEIHVELVPGQGTTWWARSRPARDAVRCVVAWKIWDARWRIFPTSWKSVKYSLMYNLIRVVVDSIRFIWGWDDRKMLRNLGFSAAWWVWIHGVTAGPVVSVRLHNEPFQLHPEDGCACFKVKPTSSPSLAMPWRLYRHSSCCDVWSFQRRLFRGCRAANDNNRSV